jgi:hypothetical protein
LNITLGVGLVVVDKNFFKVVVVQRPEIGEGDSPPGILISKISSDAVVGVVARLKQAAIGFIIFERNDIVIFGGCADNARASLC